jgi:S-DNA-T family DNA segregation ATPase FtsK/SpoIIIE
METDKKDKLKKEVKGILLGAFGLFLLIALLSFDSEIFAQHLYLKQGQKLAKVGQYCGPSF